MAACDEWNEALVDLVFGEVPDELEIRLNEHLLSCAGCREEEERLLALRSDVGGAAAVPGPDLKTRVRATLPRRSARGAGAALRRPVPAYVAVAAGLLGAFLVIVLPGGDRDGLALRGTAQRPERVVSGSGRTLFSVAGPYETAVGAPGGAAVPADSSRLTHPQAEDSL
jgi:anti-sigma factor RsiW